jgi:hypothetical protein
LYWSGRLQCIGGGIDSIESIPGLHKHLKIQAQLHFDPFLKQSLMTKVFDNNDLFYGLETICFFRLFTCEGDMEYTGCCNTEHRGLKDRVLP